MTVAGKYYKNHWTKHTLACTHFDAFSMLIPNMVIILNNSDIFLNFLKKMKVLAALVICREELTLVYNYSSGLY